MNKSEEMLLLYRIAKYYYVDNYSQNEISKLENISRPQISRLLKKAREAGIVNIDVFLPETSDRKELTKKLKDELKLKKVLLSPSSLNEKESAAGVHTMAAAYLEEILQNKKNVGIGWGKALYNTSLKLSYQEENKELTFYPLIGNSGTNNPHLQTNNIINRFAEKFQSNAYYSNTLSVALKDSLTIIESKRFDYLKKCWERLDTAIIGIGGEALSEKIYIDELPQEVYTKGILESLIGDILGTFFLENQRVLVFPEEYQIIALDLEKLKKIKDVICISYGPSKIKSIIYAAKKNYLKTLITDSDTAKGILDTLEK